MGEDGVAITGTTRETGAPPTLFGRARETSALVARLTAALGGHGGLALIAGEAGIGKTALAEAICRDAAARGARVGAGRAADVLEAPPFAIWREAITALPGFDAGAGIALPPALAPAGPGPEARGPAGVFTAVRELLAALTARTPLVLLLDDLHWADAASLDLLRFLAPALPTLPLLVLATYRADELDDAHLLHALVPALVREVDALPLALAPLTDADVRALLGARYALPPADAARLGRYVQGRTGGNPFFLGELLRALEETRTLGWRVDDGWIVGDLTVAPVPTLVRHLATARVARLDAVARTLLSLAATIGADVPLALWATVAGVDEAALHPVLHAATQARLFEPAPDGASVRFRHALIRDALYEATLPPRRRRWHREIAEALVTAPRPDPDRVAHHFRQAGDPRAALWLYRAGARAVAAAAYTDGIARYTEARDLLPPAVWGTGPFPTDAENAALAAHIRFDTGLAHALSGAVRGALAEMEAAILTLGVYPDETPALGALLDEMNVPPDRRGMVAYWHAYTGQFDAAGTVAAAVLRDDTLHSRRRGEKVYGDIQHAMMRAYGVRGEPEAAWQAYLDGLPPLTRVGLHFVAAMFGVEALLVVALPYFADDRARCAAIAAAAEAAQARAGEAAAGMPDGYGALPLLGATGRWAEARVIAERMRASGVGGSRAESAVCTLAPIALAQGDGPLVDALVVAGLPDGPETAPGATMFVRTLTLQRVAAARALAIGDHDTARRWLAAHDRWLSWNGAVLGRAEGALGWAAYHRAAGDSARAWQCAREALGHATAPRQPLALLAAHRLCGELATTMGHEAEADSHLAAALALAAACAAPHERARTLLALATLGAIRGERAVATAQVEEARALAADLGAAPLVAAAAAVAARLARSGPGRPRSTHPRGLTDQEITVLRLLAVGQTNREIAATLALTPGTVATYVRNILAKTDSANRTVAAAFARRHGII